VELKGSDVYRRTIVRASGIRIKAVSFAVPAIEPGVIVEYRWREIHSDSLADHLFLRFSRSIPVQVVRYYLRPLTIMGELAMKAQGFNASFPAPEPQKDRSSMIALTNVPADRDEPYPVPDFERRPWLFVFYEFRGTQHGKAYWQQFSKALFDSYSDRSKPNDEIRKLAAVAAPPGASDAERIAALIRIAREHVRRVDIDTADPADRRAAKQNKNAADAVKRGVGTAGDLVVVFLALAKAAGLEARVAALPDRSELFQKPEYEDGSFVRGRLVAVKAGNGWVFVDPGNEHSPTGELRWYYESQEALIGDSMQVVSARTPLSPASRSVKRRVGTFRMTDDGTLEGECRLEFTGHWADMFREQEDQDTPAEREKSLRELVVKRLPGADVSEIRIENITDVRQPYVNVYHVRIPGYAQRTGSRVFLQPAFFQKGLDAIFTSDARASNVYFPFPWSEEDEVTIELPAGFTLEQPEAPAPIDAGVGSHKININTRDGWKHLNFRRSFTFGLKDQILFPQSAYPSVKRFFDLVHSADGHTLVLRPSVSSGQPK
jgi:Transglutaminase-like superfamily